MKNANKQVLNFYRYLPFIGLGALTLLLMLVFKFNDSSTDAIKQGKDAILGFYTENLKPLFFKTDFTNEDVFNFAMYSHIPVDKEQNKVLEIGEDSGGSKYFQVKPALYDPGTKNSEKFEKYLQLDPAKKEKFNEMLESYKNDLYSAVLYNDNNTYAVNPNIDLLRKTIAADIYNFARENSPKRSQILSQNNFGNIAKNVSELRKRVESNSDNQYSNFIFFGPDTIFTGACDVDRSSLKAEAQAYASRANTSATASASASASTGSASSVSRVSSVETPYIKALPRPATPGKFEMAVFENGSKVVIPEDIYVDNFIGNINSFDFNLDSLSSAIKNFTFNITSDSSNYMRFKLNESDEDGDINFSMDFNIHGIDDLVNAAASVADGDNFGKWNNLGIAFDSLINDMQIDVNDSLVIIRNKGMNIRIEKPVKEKNSK